ncbi:efflux RND transporter periplasmic adaptor subunit [Segetibacter koreensis]|uniref:efflux RND transporter periplasmic adaptor subunit n=1 Tax=Segetibacter koreensis TaxID=398037 RepID=UPI00036F80E9|nr:efflux RND transporter periplasmic adaptor subunit [Segetibacter koreensis]
MKFIFYLVLFLSYFAACKERVEKVQPLVESITESVYASGIVKSKNQYEVFSTVSGLIQKIVVKEGDVVKKGEPLIVLVNEASKLNVENAKLAAEYSDINTNRDKLNELKINIDLARSKLMNDSLLMVRQRNLWSQQIGTKIDLEQRELAYINSKTALESSVLRYNDLKKQLNFSSSQSKKNLEITSTLAKDYTIRSEVNGRVYSILKEQGEIVTPQSPVAVIGDAANFILELQIDEFDIAKIRIGQKIMVSMDSYKGKVFEAMVQKIDPIMNDRTRSFTIEAGFISKPPVLYPNLTAEANIVIQTKEKALTIPRDYVTDDDYVITNDKQRRKVVTGLKDYQKVEILSGLTAADIIRKP